MTMANPNPVSCLCGFSLYPRGRSVQRYGLGIFLRFQFQYLRNNTKDSFPNRMYENPSIREMFKSLDLIESFGSGVGKAKRAMAENGSDDIQYQEYDENVDITSVVTPISKKYLQYSYKAMDFAMKDQNSVLKDQSLDFDGQKPTTKDQSFGFGGERIKINSVDIVGIIGRSAYSNSVRKTLTSIYDRFFNDEFSRADIVSYLNASKSGSSNYVRYLQELNVVEQVKGKGKYKFK